MTGYKKLPSSVQNGQVYSNTSSKENIPFPNFIKIKPVQISTRSNFGIALNCGHVC